MSDMLRRARSAKHRAASSLRLPSHARVLTDEEEAALGAEYAASLGLHLSVDEQRARFKRSTEGAPLVQRPLRRRLA